jgi:hypothetical protein
MKPATEIPIFGRVWTPPKPRSPNRSWLKRLEAEVADFEKRMSEGPQPGSMAIGVVSGREK